MRQYHPHDPRHPRHDLPHDPRHDPPHDPSHHRPHHHPHHHPPDDDDGRQVGCATQHRPGKAVRQWRLSSLVCTAARLIVFLPPFLPVIWIFAIFQLFFLHFPIFVLIS